MIRWERQFIRIVLTAVLIVGFGAPVLAGPGGQKAKPGAHAAKPGNHTRVDRILNDRAGMGGKSRVIIVLRPGLNASAEVKKLGGQSRRVLRLINAEAIELPNAMIRRLADHPAILSIHHDRPTAGELNRAAVAVGARMAQRTLGYTGAGVGVAIVDSGITSWHDDLSGDSSLINLNGTNGQRVTTFVDFVNGRTSQYDDNGHGTHVAGIVAGNGSASRGVRAGIAPAAHLVGLKVLDERGRGVISDVIAALDWVIANGAAHNIRVVNLSVGAAVTESYRTDPLTLATKRVVDAGVVVVTAAGNLGRRDGSQTQYGGITAPGNAPWVLTVGAYSHEGTIVRKDDVMAGYSSRGPTAIDFTAKPDVVAPGTGIVSLSDPGSLMYYTKPANLLNGVLVSSYKPYLSLSGTSMAAPIVTGTVALMLQANPSLTPNMVKAIVQYTAERHAGYDGLTQGAGFVNTMGAVDLARFYRTASAGDRFRMPRAWSKQIIWGNQRITGGVIRPNVNAFKVGTTWGATSDLDGDNIVWGTVFGRDSDNIVWGTFDSLDADNIVWGTLLDGNGDDIVWGTFRDGDDIVWGTFRDGDDIVWGTFLNGDNIVWGTDCGGADCYDIVWGTSTGGLDGDNIVWGTAELAENIVWGTSGDIDNIVWGTASEPDNATWGNSGEESALFDDPLDEPVSYDGTVWEDIFAAEPIAVDPVVEETLVVEELVVTEPVLKTSTTTTISTLGGF